VTYRFIRKWRHSVVTNETERIMILTAWRLGAVALAALCVGACATMGTGVGETRGGGQGVNFSWKAQDAVKGQMTATLANGETLSGPMFQITSDTRVDDVTPMVAGWHRRWGGWGGFGGWGSWDAGPDFITHYSGRVVANLAGANGDRMRCNFRLVRPASGMSGGGQGKCQLTGGKTIDATFPAA
jgi:hypothetical protein